MVQAMVVMAVMAVMAVIEVELRRSLRCATAQTKVEVDVEVAEILVAKMSWEVCQRQRRCKR